MTRFRLLLVACLLPLLWVHGSFAGEMVVFADEAESRGPVLLPSGHLLRVVLPGNASTGKTWELLSPPGMVVTQSGAADYIPEGSDLKAGGRFHLSFRSANPGTTTLRFVYRASGGEPERSFSLVVTVPLVPDFEEVFSLLDKNSDSMVSREEFLAAPSFPVPVNSNGRFMLPALQVDSNSDGLITARELKENLFLYYDTDRGGFLLREEIQKILGGAFIRFAL